MTKQQFITTAIAAAQKCSANSGLPPGVTVAQAALESAWGESRLSQKANNYFGIKALGDSPCIAMPTTEVVAGPGGVATLQKLTARFARYTSIEECFAARDRILLSAAVYAEARSHRSEPIAFIHSLAKHWATDPAYAEKLEQLYLAHGLAMFDRNSQFSPISASAKDVAIAAQ